MSTLVFDLVLLTFTDNGEGDDDEEDEDEEDEEESREGPQRSQGREEEEGCDMELVGMCMSGFFYTAAGFSHLTSPFAFSDSLCW